MATQKSKENIINLNDFKKADVDEEKSSNNKEKSFAPFDGDSMERFTFLRENFTEVKEIIIKRYLKENNIPQKNLVIDFRFKVFRNHFDPIMLGGVTYDGYLYHDKQEIFFGVLFNDRIHPSYDNSYYNYLSKFYFYNKNSINIKNTKFILILADVPNLTFKYKDLRHLYLTQRFMERFKPAIEKSWMTIEKMKFSNKDFNEWYNMIKYK